jgi:hypothetical protein
MTDIVFAEKGQPPRDDELAAVLGRSGRRWKELLDHLAETYPPLTETWKFYRQSGWILRVMRRKRTILWLVPCRRHFRASTAFGEKAVAAAVESDLPAEVIEAVRSARRYAEGRAVRLEVRTVRDLEVVKRIAAIKMAN